MRLVPRWLLDPKRPSRNQFLIRGIDVSHHNGQIDWAAFAQIGNRYRHFAFIKATEGSDWQDTAFQTNWNQARKQQIPVGAYHFFTTQSSGAAQAQNFINVVPKALGALPPVIDVEVALKTSRMTKEEVIANLHILIEHINSHYGQTPIIYTTTECQHSYLTDWPIDQPWTRAVLVWQNPLAKDWIFWQFSSRGRLPALEGRVDLNVYRGSQENFDALLAP